MIHRLFPGSYDDAEESLSPTTEIVLDLSLIVYVVILVSLVVTDGELD